MNWNNRRGRAVKRFFLFGILLVVLSGAISALADDNMKAFPQPEAGMIRYVLQLPVKDDETLYKVELIVGRMVMIDSVNQYRFGGSIEPEVIQGWGYTRYVVDKIGPMMGTMMAVDPNAPKVERFIAIGGESYLIRYNSRLPVVVYVPEGCEVRYRIWSGEAEMFTMKKR